MLHEIIEDAIQSGADSVELEYVVEGLEVTYFFGHSGVGKIVKDRQLVKEIIGELVERAKLENKSRGALEWVYRGKSYKITVAEYENFGETAFRLRFGQPKQKRP